MENAYTIFFFFTTLILIFGVNHVMSAGGSQVETSGKVEGSGKVLPIILLKESNILEIPNGITFESGCCFWKRMSFHANTGLYEKFFCGADAAERKKIQEAQTEVANTKSSNHLVSENCLFEAPSLRWISSLPITPNCGHEPKPFISQLNEPEKKISEDESDYKNLRSYWLSCGPASSHERKLYRFGYQLWIDSTLLNSSTQLVPPLTKSMAHPYKNTIDYEIYRFCYDNSTQDLLYTKHTILSPALLSNDNLKEGSKTYDIEISNYSNKRLDFEKIKKIYDQVNKSNIEDIPVINQDIEETLGKSNLMHYKMEKIIPDEDLAFILWKKPTFHYVNHHLMHEALLKPWNEIKELVRERARTTHLELDIYTGIFDISTKAGKNQTARTSEEVRIPEVWIKIVQCYFNIPKDEIYVNNGIAIIANNHMDRTLERTISEYCGNKSMYQYYSEKDEAKKKEYSFIRSCHVTPKIEELFGLDLKIELSLELPMFVTSIYDP